MKLLPLAVMIIGVVIGVVTDHILWGFWGGLLAALITIAGQRRGARVGK